MYYILNMLPPYKKNTRVIQKLSFPRPVKKKDNYSEKFISKHRAMFQLLLNIRTTGIETLFIAWDKFL